MKVGDLQGAVAALTAVSKELDGEYTATELSAMAAMITGADIPAAHLTGALSLLRVKPEGGRYNGLVIKMVVESGSAIAVAARLETAAGS